MKDFNNYVQSSKKEFIKIAEQTIQNIIGGEKNVSTSELTSILLSLSDKLTLERLRLYHEWLHS